MGSVPGIVYVSVGALVTVVSLGIGPEFKIFFYAGLAFLTFGGAVSFIGAMQYHGAKKTEEKKRMIAQQEKVAAPPQYAQQFGNFPQQQGQMAQRPNQRQAPVQPHQGQQPAHHGHAHAQRQAPLMAYKPCMNCRAAVRATDNFCSRCGMRT